MDEIETNLKEEGILAFENNYVDKDFLKLPKYLDNISSADIGRYLHTFTIQRMYVRSVLTRVKVAIMETEFRLKNEKARISEFFPAKMSVTDKELKMRTYEGVMGILDELTKLEAKQEYLKDIMESLEDGKFSISREMTRRGVDFKDDRRLTKVE